MSKSSMDALQGTMRPVRIDLGRGVSTVVAAMVVGAYALHPQHGGRPEEPGWAITHRHSGLLVWKTRTVDQAIAVAQWLRDHGTLPPEATVGELIDWVKGGDPPRGPALALALGGIAPRWDGKTGEVEP